MKISPDLILKAALVAGGVLLGTGGTIGVQQTTEPAKPQIIQVKPECPSIYLDNVKIERRKNGLRN